MSNKPTVFGMPAEPWWEFRHLPPLLLPEPLSDANRAALEEWLMRVTDIAPPRREAGGKTPN